LRAQALRATMGLPGRHSSRRHHRHERIFP
jgi:hypothetical protein